MGYSLGSKALLLLFHSIILIGAGHGIGILLFLDITTLNGSYIDSISRNVLENYQARLAFTGLISILGKALIILSIFKHQSLLSKRLADIGQVFLTISFFILIIGDWSFLNLYILSAISGIPFFLYTIRIFYLKYWQ